MTKRNRTPSGVPVTDTGRRITGAELVREQSRILNKYYATADKAVNYAQRVAVAWLTRNGLAAFIFFTTELYEDDILALDLERHFRRDSAGRVVGIHMSCDETSSGHAIDLTLSHELANGLARYLGKYRALLPDGGSSALFPDPSGIDPLDVVRDIMRRRQQRAFHETSHDTADDPTVH